MSSLRFFLAMVERAKTRERMWKSPYFRKALFCRQRKSSVIQFVIVGKLGFQFQKAINVKIPDKPLFCV